MPIPIPDRLFLAGDCVKCANFDLLVARYTDECKCCSRYHGDLFTPRKETETVEKRQ